MDSGRHSPGIGEDGSMRSSGPRAASPDFPASPTQRARLELPFTEQTVNHYEILGVAPAASEAEIRKAFHRLARRWHPDKAPSGTPNWVFLKIHRAYELLSDEQRRQRYDGGGGSSDEEQEQEQEPEDYSGVPVPAWKDEWSYSDFEPGELDGTVYAPDANHAYKPPSDFDLGSLGPPMQTRGAVAAAAAAGSSSFLASPQQPNDGAHIGADGMIHAQGRMAEHGELETARTHWLQFRDSIQIKGDDEQRREQRAHKEAEGYVFFTSNASKEGGHDLISGRSPAVTEHGTNIGGGIFAVHPNFLAGVCGDWAIRRTQGRRLLVRHVCVGISFLGPIGCLLAIVYLPQPSANLVLGLILLTHFTAGANAAGSYCIVLDIFPASAASFTGVDNTIAQSTGIIAPLVTGVLLDAGHCPSGSSEGQAAGSGSGGDAAVPPSCLEAWQRVWIICVALFLGGWVLFVGLTLAEPRYRR